MAFTTAPLPLSRPTASRPSTSPRRRAHPSAARMTLAAPPPKPAFLAEPVTPLQDVSDYLATLEHHKDKLVVLKIFAPWCRSCRALTPKFNRLAREFPHVKFAKLNYEDNKDLCYRIGVTAMPTFVFYHGEAGEIDKFSCGPKRADVLRTKIEDCVRGMCLLEGTE